MRWRVGAAVAVLLGAVALALALPRTQVNCSQPAFRNSPPPPPCPGVYGMIPLRITIVVVAVVFAVFFVWDSHRAPHRRW